MVNLVTLDTIGVVGNKNEGRVLRSERTTYEMIQTIRV